MSYTLVVAVRDADLSDDEADEYGGILRDLTMFRRGREVEDLRDALDFWTARGFSAHIFRDLEDFSNDS